MAPWSLFTKGSSSAKLRRQSLPASCPAYAEKDAPGVDVGAENESLPTYSCSLAAEGCFDTKLEMISPFDRSEARSWISVYVVLRGTVLRLHTVRRPISFSKGLRNRTPEVRAGTLIRSYTLQHAEVGIAVDYTKRPLVMRVRAEEDQFLLSCSDVDMFISWVEWLSAAIDIALPIDERTFPRYRTIPPAGSSGGSRRAPRPVTPPPPQVTEMDIVREQLAQLLLLDVGSGSRGARGRHDEHDRGRRRSSNIVLGSPAGEPAAARRRSIAVTTISTGWFSRTTTAAAPAANDTARSENEPRLSWRKRNQQRPLLSVASPSPSSSSSPPPDLPSRSRSLLATTNSGPSLSPSPPAAGNGRFGQFLRIPDFGASGSSSSSSPSSLAPSLSPSPSSSRSPSPSPAASPSASTFILEQWSLIVGSEQAPAKDPGHARERRRNDEPASPSSLGTPRDDNDGMGRRIGVGTSPTTATTPVITTTTSTSAGAVGRRRRGMSAADMCETSSATAARGGDMDAASAAGSVLVTTTTTVTMTDASASSSSSSPHSSSPSSASLAADTPPTDFLHPRRYGHRHQVSTATTATTATAATTATTASAASAATAATSVASCAGSDDDGNGSRSNSSSSNSKPRNAQRHHINSSNGSNSNSSNSSNRNRNSNSGSSSSSNSRNSNRNSGNSSSSGSSSSDAWTPAQKLRYARRCLRRLPEYAPRRRDVLVKDGKLWKIDWHTETLRRCRVQQQQPQQPQEQPQERQHVVGGAAPASCSTSPFV